jgi:uncharacterized protein YjbJ (UPF0337 family)
MNWTVIEDNWTQFKGKARERWSRLTDEELDMIAGKRNLLAGKIQEAYCVTLDEAEWQIRDFQGRDAEYESRQRKAVGNR